MSSQSVPPVVGRTQLARTGDRLDRVLLVTGIAVALLGLPVAAAVGSEKYAAASVVSAEQLRSRHRTVATLLSDTPPYPVGAGPGSGAQILEVSATWRAPDGSMRLGEVVAGHGVKAGSTVGIWLDGQGAKVDPPLTSEGVVITALALGALVWTILIALMATLHLAIRVTHKRVRARRWAVEWAAIEPEWTGRSR